MCECCNLQATLQATDGAPVCPACFNAGCNYAEVRCQLADIEGAIADGAEYLYESPEAAHE